MGNMMAGFLATLVCLNDEEFHAASPALGMGPEDRQGLQCLLDELGGPEGVTALLSPDAGPPIALFSAALECNLQLSGESSSTSVPVNTPTSPPIDIPTAAAVPTAPPAPIATSPAPTLQPTTQLSVAVAAVPDGLPSYDRGDWRHWTDEDGDCQDTRHEVLTEESQTSVRYKSDKQCQVASGQWFGAYTATTITEAGKLDIDHLVPLANAHKSGGWAWTSERKRQYANSLDDPDHLIAVTAGANRSKGAKGPEEWRPSNEAYWCEYAIDWIRVKQTWKLTATPEEAEALRDMLETCTSPPHLTTTETEAPSGPASPTQTPAAGNTYASCDEAEEAGEQRVQGSRGPGRGFPLAMVPSARDGDGDGVVCER